MVGWDVSRKYATFGPGDAAALRELGPLGIFAVEIQATLEAFAAAETAIAGFDLPDPIAVAVALDPAVATDVRFLNVMVETSGELTTGQTVVDHLGIAKRPPNVHVVLEASRERFVRLLHDALR
jgi:purine nucleosidase